ncbi:MAG TPA: Asp-tRNA(Asn)/Glu-tRNA(Gln) amidotransferase subunit GatC [Thermoanaerobaculia bacterium]|nr:Asp-tRNA(Asn)/Glu-tRNA(Gln) amidotransferase subunit GatC [Thermoanaerobaculia bacterium]
MNISRDEARRIADLAHLEFDDASLDRLAAEMTKILGYIERLPDVEGHAAASQTGVMRDDVVTSTLNMGDFFVVPKVIE